MLGVLPLVFVVSYFINYIRYKRKTYSGHRLVWIHSSWLIIYTIAWLTHLAILVYDESYSAYFTYRSCDDREELLVVIGLLAVISWIAIIFFAPDKLSTEQMRYQRLWSAVLWVVVSICTIGVSGLFALMIFY